MADENEITLPEVVRRLLRVEAELRVTQGTVALHDRAITLLRSLLDRLRGEYRKCTLKSDFRPVQRIVFGIVGLILIGVATAVMSLVLRK